MMTVSEKKRALQEAHTETQQFVATKRIELMQALQEMNELMATDDYSLSLLQILRTFKGPQGLAFLGQVLPDHDLLLAARKKLREPDGDRPKMIEEFRDETDKTKVMIRLLAANTAAEQEA